MRRMPAVLVTFVLFIAGCTSTRFTVDPAAAPRTSAPTEAEAIAFVDSSEAVLYDLGVKAARAAWVQATYITEDTQTLSAEATENQLNAAVAFATEAARFDGLDLPYNARRQLNILKRGLTMPAPPDQQKTAELSGISVGMESRYGSGEYCTDGGTCYDLGDLENIMANSRDPDSLLMAWAGWRTVSPPMKDDYVRFVELMNEGARSLGFADTGEMWRSNYDMDPDSFAAEMDRLWVQVMPLYKALHCYVEDGLAEFYGEEVDAWWDLRAEYQGVAAPVDRDGDDFDPGAKFHIPANVPYSRYFLAHILQFQFHRSLCEVAGFEGPLHRCSIYGSTEAGERLNAMMEMGRSRPWPEALAVLTGGDGAMDATAILDYFAPLKSWLDEANTRERGSDGARECGVGR